jgi:hypothetical protein
MKTSKADKWFSYFIRLRDSNDDGYCKCFTCNTILHWKHMECGHYVKRQHEGARFNEKNCHTQCNNCNWKLQGNDGVYKPRIIEMYGQETHDLLKSAEHRNFKRTSFEVDLLAKEYEKKARQLALEKGISLK